MVQNNNNQMGDDLIVKKCYLCNKEFSGNKFSSYCSERCFDIEEQSQKDEIRAEQVAADYLYGVRD